MAGEEFDRAAEGIRIDAVAEPRAGHLLRLDAMRRHRLRRCLHHRVGNNLIIGAMDKQYRRTAFGQTDPVNRQQGT